MHNGHSGRRKAFVSRSNRSAAGSPRPLSLKEIVKNGHLCGPILDGHGAASCQSRPLCLSGRLPINLRRFLVQQLGQSLHVDDHEITATGQGPDSLLMRELARAIRSFSAMRSRERWAQCAVGLTALEEKLQEAARSGQPAVLCLGCAELAVCTQQPGHGRTSCVTVTLGSAAGDCPCMDTVCRAIERFRNACAAEGAPHHDLDCYMSRGQVIFTWRPLAACGLA